MAMALALCDGPYSWSGLLPESKQIYLLPITVSLTQFFCNETSRTWASWVLKPGNMGLDQTQVPVGHNWVAKHSRVPTTWVWVPTLDKPSKTTFRNGKMMTCPIKQCHRWREELKDGWKRQWEKNMLRNPFHNLPEKLQNAWPVPTIFIGLILGTKEVKDRRTLTCLGNSYKGTEDSGAFGTHWGVAPARVLQLHTLPLACSQEV